MSDIIAVMGSRGSDLQMIKLEDAQIEDSSSNREEKEKRNGIERGYKIILQM